MGKWELHRFYAKDGAIAAHMPATAILTRASLGRFMARYGSVYVKPNYEHAGKGILKAWKSAGGYTVVKIRGARVRLRSVDALHAWLRRAGAGKRHIVQRTIDLARVGGRRYDVRVMMLRGGDSAWKYVGMLAKVAGPGSVITNVSRGRGYAAPIGPTLARSLRATPARVAAIRRKLVALSYRIVKRCRGYKYTSQIGIDFGIDPRGRIWLIEVNFDYPSHALFNRLRDKSMYRAIKRTVAAYRNRRSRRRRTRRRR